MGKMPEPIRNDPSSHSGFEKSADSTDAVSAADSLPSVEKIVSEIESDLEGLEGTLLRKRLRALQLQWHPDRAWRYQIDSALSCQVFTFVQSAWEAHILDPAPVTTAATDGEEMPSAAGRK